MEITMELCERNENRGEVCVQFISNAVYVYVYIPHYMHIYYYPFDWQCWQLQLLRQPRFIQDLLNIY